jgi:predicted DNA-binding transcriptional regulator YafY
VYHPTVRVLAVLEMLQSRPGISGAELAERLEVDARTVRRYVAMLQDLGIPVEAERGRYGGYRVRPGFKLPPLMFSDDEALAVVLGLLAARRLGLAFAAPAVEGALAKVERVLPETLRDRVRALQDTLTLDLAPSDAPPAGDTVVTLTTASRQGRRVWMRYRASSTEEETERLLDPYGVVYRTGRWYAAGYCHLRAGLRVFRLDRVLEARLSDERFSRPPDFDTLAYVLRSLATAGGTWTVEVLLETTLPEARRRISPAVAILEEAPGGVLMRSSEQDLDWIARYLAALPWPMTIHRPPELRTALRQVAATIAAMADRSPNDV